MLFGICVVIGIVLFLLFESRWEGSGRYDDHWKPAPRPRPLAPVPAALRCKPDNDGEAPCQAPTLPASRKRASRAA